MTEQFESGQLLLTSRQAAQALQISERKLWSMKASGEIPHVLLGPLCAIRPQIDSNNGSNERKHGRPTMRNISTPQPTHHWQLLD